MQSVERMTFQGQAKRQNLDAKKIGDKGVGVPASLGVYFLSFAQPHVSVSTPQWCVLPRWSVWIRALDGPDCLRGEDPMHALDHRVAVYNVEV
jgi:hypothetical protein